MSEISVTIPMPADEPDEVTLRPYRKRKGEGHVRREEILLAARALFVEEGYELTTIRKIAARAGVSTTALYLYYADKDAIMIAICDRTFEKLLARFDEIEVREPHPLRQLQAMMECYLRFGLSHPDEYKLTFVAKSLGIAGLTHRQPEIDPSQPGSKGPLGFRRLMNMVERAMQAGYLRGEDPALVSELIWAGGHGLVTLLITHVHFPFSERERLIQGMLSMQFQGLLAEDHR